MIYGTRLLLVLVHSGSSCRKLLLPFRVCPVPRSDILTSSNSSTGLVRFVPRSNPSKVLIGEPVDPELDVGLALYRGKEVLVHPFSGSSVLSPGQITEVTETIERVLSPLAQSEVGSIRCIGLNVGSHIEIPFIE